MSSNDRSIYCPNPNCQTLNPQTHAFCQNCRTPIPHLYLWASGPSKSASSVLQEWSPGSLLQERYLVVGPQRLLDTRPGWMPSLPEDLSEALLTYLRLQPWRLHLPEVYGVLPSEAGELLLLEKGPLDSEGNLRPLLEQVWSETAPLRQLSWLAQILSLWTPLTQVGAAASLLWPENLRVDGPLMRLRELLFDEPEQPLPITQLIALWSRWMAQSSLLEQAPGLQELCNALGSGRLSVDEAQGKLDSILVNHAQTVPLSIQIVGGTDKGPQRTQNEDTCYPDRVVLGGVAREVRIGIVCDGIGGHEGGEVASRQAVQTLRPQAQALIAELDREPVTAPPVVAAQLDAMVRVVNNLIVSQNDGANREARQRMGTTLVMALAPASGATQSSHEFYLAHVGDSRAYWINRDSCHQLTVDDDVASREVRLGHALYREALQRPDAGALTQALGTRASDFLHPTVQRFILDDDSVILLCSDGLSDYDRVEQNWLQTLRPILDQQISLPEACNQLIELANTQNGHDNVSVVLIHVRLTAPSPPSELKETLSPSQVAGLAAGADQTEVPTIREDFQAQAAAEAADYANLVQTQTAPEEPLPEPLPLPTLHLGQSVPQADDLRPKQPRRWLEARVAALLLLGLLIGIGTWLLLNPDTRETLRQQLQRDLPTPAPSPEPSGPAQSFPPLPSPVQTTTPSAPTSVQELLTPAPSPGQPPTVSTPSVPATPPL